MSAYATAISECNDVAALRAEVFRQQTRAEILAAEVLRLRSSSPKPETDGVMGLYSRRPSREDAGFGGIFERNTAAEAVVNAVVLLKDNLKKDGYTGIFKLIEALDQQGRGKDG
jgi:hypothetical protein